MNHKFFDENFSSPFVTVSKESILTKCSSNNFTNENSHKKTENKKLLFERIVLDLKDNKNC